MRRRFHRAFVSPRIILLTFPLVAAVAPQAAQAWTYKVLHSFCEAEFCSDGQQPGPLSMDLSGNFYGVAQGGAQHDGVVFELAFDGDTGKWAYKILYDFCAQLPCSNYVVLNGALVIDRNGNLYGVTQPTTKHNSAVFELLPNSDRSTWKFRVLYRFCAQKGGECPDGYSPTALTYAGAATGALYDGKSPLYGITPFGGAYDGGTAFQLSPSLTGKQWQHTKLYDFCAQTACADGLLPNGPVTLDKAGNLYGTSRLGGQKNRGIIFKLRPNGGVWTQKVLYSFCAMRGCKDGGTPVSGVLIDAKGNLLGTNANETQKCVEKLKNCGVVYKFDPKGGLSVLYSFCHQPDCSDGKIPEDEVVMNPDGTLLGTTVEGGSANSGVVFALGDTYKALHSFCSELNCTDGGGPGALVLDGAGDIFGTTGGGGASSQGVIFELSP